MRDCVRETDARWFRQRENPPRPRPAVLRPHSPSVASIANTFESPKPEPQSINLTLLARNPGTQHPPQRVRDRRVHGGVQQASALEVPDGALNAGFRQTGLGCNALEAYRDRRPSPVAALPQ